LGRGANVRIVELVLFSASEEHRLYITHVKGCP
jgi:hypothetical protein